MSNLTRQQFDAAIRQQDDPAPIKAKTDKHNFRTFWFVCVPGGALAAFLLTLLSQDGGVFIPAWAVGSMVLWGITSSFTKEDPGDRD